MEYLALYRKYRPKELDEVVGQGEIKKILASSIQKGTITHAYLFSGPRGTGKTTMAKILAKMVNCESPVNGNACNKCQSCLNILNSNDVIEIDAASNNGVDEIRDLREKANLVPTNSKYKVYIIDEVHMLTTQAFNALLKTLEEPPKHVIFVLATTEYYKIPLTITSRCQKFQFNKISNNDIVERLKKISLLEKIDIDDDALMEIAKISDGGMRDSINFLDQLRSFNDGKITLNDVYDVCGNVSSQEIVDLFVDICNNNAEKITNFFETMDLNGKNYGKFFEDVISFLKDVVLVKREVDYKYIKSNIEDIKKIANLFTLDNIFYMIVFINKLLGRLSSVSRQSVIVIANFLLMMDRINSIYEVKKVNDKVKKTHDNENEEFIKFTSSRKENSDNLTDNIDVKDDKVLNDSNDLIPKISVKNKEIIINNTFAVASKVIKNNLQSKFSMISDYLTDKKFTSIVGTLIDTTIEVAGDNYLILSAKSDLIVDKIYSNYRLCNEFLKMIFNSEYNFVVINNNEWNNYRDEYIKNIRSGKKYELKELDDNNLIQELVSASEPTIVDKLFDLVGEDSVEFK
mgnify:CR=1 FL=1